jgi:hypothetical protein
MAAMMDFGNSIVDIRPFPVPAPSQRAELDIGITGSHGLTFRWRAAKGGACCIEARQARTERSLAGKA